MKGKVVDVNNHPIPYVNIGVQNEKIGATTDEDGSFYLPIKEEKMIVFSALGYEKKILSSSAIQTVQMISTTYQLNEVVIINKKETRTFELSMANGIAQAFENGPKIDAIYFPYDSKVKKNRYLKKIGLFTESNIETASVKIHFYTVKPDGLPGEELLTKDLVVQVKQGSRKSYFDISDRNLVFPKEGLFVAVERLLIEKNKWIKNTTAIDGSLKTQTIYFPLLFYNFVEKDFTYTYYGGTWYKEFKKIIDPTSKSRVFEPAISLILTN
ncbi:carboxypeptidase-like regulatory domain-containing protein [Flavobacterium oreochromis]|uniref:carboxypeptidase-like regulatory domain-containing protein n=1 Tax=Flavobacterium oreochromis TaxID=2906078 RepID=UPI00385B80EA